MKRKTFEAELSGTQYEGRSERIEAVRVGDLVSLVREPDNIYDPQAIDVRSADGSLGHIPADVACELAPLIDKELYDCTAVVSSVTRRSERSGRARKALISVKVECVWKQGTELSAGRDQGHAAGYREISDAMRQVCDLRDGIYTIQLVTEKGRLLFETEEPNMAMMLEQMEYEDLPRLEKKEELYGWLNTVPGALEFCTYIGGDPIQIRNAPLKERLAYYRKQTDVHVGCREAGAVGAKWEKFVTKVQKQIVDVSQLIEVREEAVKYYTSTERVTEFDLPGLEWMKQYPNALLYRVEGMSINVRNQKRENLTHIHWNDMVQGESIGITWYESEERVTVRRGIGPEKELTKGEMDSFYAAL